MNGNVLRLISVLSGLSLGLRSIAGMSDFSLPPVPVELTPVGQGHFTLRAGQESGSSIQLEDNRGFSAKDFFAVATANQKRIQLSARSRPLEIILTPFRNSKLLLAPSNTVTLTIDADRRIVDLSAPARNAAKITLQLPDHAFAKLGPNSVLRYDLFSDQSYYLAGAGDISGQNAEGQALQISEKEMPVAGGPLKVPAAGDPNQRFQKLRPDTIVHVSGVADGELSIQVGNEAFAMTGRGERQWIQTPNGTKIEFWQNLNLTMLEWKVTKGLLRLDVEGVPGWEAVSRSDQSGQIQWDASAHLIDLRNATGDSEMVVRLQNNSVVRVGPKATFQYGYKNPFTFSTSAYGGRVLLQNEENQQATDLTQENLTFVSGQLRQTRQDLGTLHPESLDLAWDYGAPFQLEGLPPLPPNTKKIIDIGGDRKIAIEYNDKGNLLITAVQGHFVLRMSALNGISVNLPENDSADLSLDMKKGTFIVRATPSNPDLVNVSTATGASTGLAPDKYINFQIGHDGSLTAVSGGRLIAYEPSGSQPTSAPKTEVPALIKKGDDVTRIPQTPASRFQ